MKRAAPPRDKMDMACKDHDLCYEALGWGDAGCNRDLRMKLTEIVDSGNPSREQLNTALAFLEVFEKLRERHVENGPDTDIEVLKSKILKHSNFAAITGAAPSVQYHSALKSGHKESPVDQQNLELGWSEVSKTVSQTFGINRWYIGFDDKQRVHPGIDFRTDDFYSSTTEITLARKDNLRRPFVKMSYLVPFDGRQRDAIALQPSSTQGASGYDSLKIDLHLGGLAASAVAQGNKDSYFDRAHRFLTSVDVGYAMTHGFGNGVAKENVAFVQAGSQIDSGVLSGNIVGVAKGQSVAFHTQFEKFEIGSDLLILTKTTDENLSVIVGGFSHRYRRPTDQSEFTVSAVNCPSCAGGQAVPLYDADYRARGLMIGYDANLDYPKKGSDGSFKKVAVRYGYGLNNSAKLHDSAMDLFDGRKIYYDWTVVSGNIAKSVI